jgi:hypothetical protein
VTHVDRTQGTRPDLLSSVSAFLPPIINTESADVRTHEHELVIHQCHVKGDPDSLKLVPSL